MMVSRKKTFESNRLGANKVNFDIRLKYEGQLRLEFLELNFQMTGAIFLYETY